MKLDIIIVDLILIAAVALPYILFILLGKKEEGGLKSKFFEEVKKNELHLQEKDKWNTNIVGLDKEKAKIIIVQKRKAGFVTELIDLRQVQACSILQETQTLKLNKRTANILQKIDLQFILFDGSIQIINLFNCEETFSQEYELVHAEKWNQIINKSLVNRPIVNSAA